MSDAVLDFDAIQRQVAWTPQPGPQEAAIRASFVDEVFFGGARGGGKSDFLIGDYAGDVLHYGPAWRGILFRRNFPDLEEIEMRTKELFYGMFPGCEYRIGTRTWHFPNGAFLRLRHMESEADADKYQGHQYCVAEDTPVLMASGCYRPIQEVRVGDYVQTLEGPRRVTDTIAPYETECVDLSINSKWVQSHPLNHPILTTSSWQSYASLLENASIATSTTSPVSPQPSSVDCFVIRRGHDAPDADLPSIVLDASIANPVPCKRNGWSVAKAPIVLQQISDLYRGHGRTPESPVVRLSYALSPFSVGGGAYGPLGSGIAQDFQCDYPAGYRSYGEQPPSQIKSAQDDAPLRADVALRSLSAGCIADAVGSIGERILLRPQRYVHPYTQSLRQMSGPVDAVSCRMTPCGKRKVYDLTIDEVNHYITTDQGLVSANTWIAFDELPTWPSLKGYHMLKACLRSPHNIPNKRIRATGNPGGVGHVAVKKYFEIEGATRNGYHLIEDPDSGMTRMFIPSKVQDNAILMENDPGYIGRLKAQGHGDSQLVKAWLDGDWDAFVGQYFSMWNGEHIMVSPFEIPKDWPLFGGLDYGEASPTSFGLYTVDYDDNLIRLFGYYQANATATEHAYEVKKALELFPYTKGRMPEAVYSDPSMWVTRKLSDTYSKCPADFFKDQGLYVVRATNDRVPGWRICKDLLSQRKFQIFEGWNEDFIRTVPALPRSRTNPEDLDTRAEDHCADDWRYCSMHVWSPIEPEDEREKQDFEGADVISALRSSANKSARIRMGATL